MEKARVFISCGQQDDKEKQYGIKAADFFREKGFEPYFAEDIHTAEALTENIFNALKKSEYFVCINFERCKSKIGSLFIQQELAIASYLKTPMLVFHVGKIDLAGVENYLIINSFKINDTKELLKILNAETIKWDATSKNQLFLEFDNKPSKNLIITNRNRNILIDNYGNPIKADYYHIIVLNQSSTINVRNTTVYLESIYNSEENIYLLKDEDYKFELTWAGTGLININIPIKGKREFDAFYYNQNDNKIYFQHISTTTSEKYNYPPLKKGRYNIKYIIFSENMPPARIEVEIDFNNDIKILNSKQL